MKGVDLRTAVESGRRYRYPGNREWRGPGTDNPPILGTSLSLALDDCWEIEPEPEKPREWTICGSDESAWIIHDNCASDFKVRVHDADACDLQRARDHGGVGVGGAK